MRVVNGGLEDLFITVWDLNTADENVVLDDWRLNKSDSYGLLLQKDGDGNFSIRWRAQKMNGDENDGQASKASSSIDQDQRVDF
jgi:hypothetical protein